MDLTAILPLMQFWKEGTEVPEPLGKLEMLEVLVIPFVLHIKTDEPGFTPKRFAGPQI